jgi:flavin-dependent dehydrogenase
VSALLDALVVGGGPAGLAFAAAAAGRGLSVVVVEPRPLPADKACGEGLLPAGVAALTALGARARLGPGQAMPLAAVRWIDDAGSELRVALPAPGGLGVRRTALSAALLGCATAAGARILPATAVDHRRLADRVEVKVARDGARGPAERLSARLLVAADGAGSAVRRREGLDRPVAGPVRLGLRRHLAVAPWSDEVEVHLGGGGEAYVTPVGPGEVGVAFLLEAGAQAPFEAVLDRFPRLSARLAGARPSSSPRGAGPLRRRARSVVADRLALLGDAAGYEDAITGEGLSLALASALELAALAPGALAAGATRASLLAYQRGWARRFRAYVRATRAVLWLARRPRARRLVLALGRRYPRSAGRVVAGAVGPLPSAPGATVTP